MNGEPSPFRSLPARVTLADVGFLVGIVALSVLLYVPGLGFYSDDWGLLERLHAAADHSLPGLYQALLPTGIGTRPMQGVLLAVLYRMFGLEPLGYHVANAGMLAAMVVLLYLCLRDLGLPRLVALTVPLVFSVLPHYSTGRIWIAAFQAPLAVLLYLGSLYADIRFFRGGRVQWAWRLAGIVALAGSVLAYEITAALFVLNPFLLWLAAHWRSTDYGPERRRAGLRRLGLLLGSNVVALAIATAYKASTTGRMALFEGLLWRIRYAVEGATSVAFGSYGLLLPRAVARTLGSHFDPAVLGLSLLVGGLAWGYLGRTVDEDSRREVSGRAWLGLIVVGLTVFAAGYGAALLTFEIGFDTTGMNNRTAQAAALGVATTFVGAIGGVAAWIPTSRSAWRFFRLGLSGLIATGCFLVNTIAAHWVEASERQEQVVETVHRTWESIPPETVVLLDGLCPYVGPGVVFETGWDVSGMLRLEFGDRSLRGDVVGPDTEASAEGVRTLLYDDVINVYPYGDRLRVLDVRTGEARTLATRAAAERYLARSGRGKSCPPGEEGYGVRIF